MTLPHSLVGQSPWPLSMAAAAALGQGGAPSPPPVLPATIAGDKIFMHTRMTELGPIDPAGPSPIWLNGLDNFGAQVFNGFGYGARAVLIDDVIDGYQGLRCNYPAVVYSSLCGEVAEGDKISLFAVARPMGGDSSVFICCGPAVIADTPGFWVGYSSEHYSTGHRLWCRMGFQGEGGGGSAATGIGFDVPAQRAHLLGLHYDSVQGIFEVDGEQHAVATGGAGINATNAGNIYPTAGDPAGSPAAPVDLVDWIVAVGLTSVERDAIREQYFARRYPSLRLS